MTPDPSNVARENVHVAQHIWKRMSGGSGSLLISDSESQVWVVKFAQNPQHHRLQLNEFLATRIAEQIGLTVPQPGIVQVSSEVLLAWTPEVLSPKLKRVYTAGLHFGSRFAGSGTMPGRVTQTLFPEQLRLVENLSEVLGALVFDTWLNQRDLRQAVFAKEKRSSKLNAFWIDHGACFGAGSWNLDTPCGPIYRQNPFYEGLSQWADIDPWLRKIEEFPVDQLWQTFYETPSAWRRGEEEAFTDLLHQLKHRQGRVRTLLLDVIYKRRRHFPNWPDHLRSSDLVELNGGALFEEKQAARVA